MKPGNHDNGKQQLAFLCFTCFFMFQKESHLNFVKYFLGIKIYQLKLKFYESLLPWQ